MEEKLTQTQKWLLIGFIAIMLCGGASRIYFSSDFYNRRMQKHSSFVFSQKPEKNMLTIDVDGAVRRPGVYRILKGSTISDAVREAGGFSQGAVTKDINLAQVLVNRSKIFIPSADGTIVRQSAAYGDDAAEISGQPQFQNTSQAAASSNGDISEGEKQAPKIVNINSANETELQTLPGVGPAYAKKIIELRRQRKKFVNIEEIMIIKGIGPKKFQQMKPYLRAE